MVRYFIFPYFTLLSFACSCCILLYFGLLYFVLRYAILLDSTLTNIILLYFPLIASTFFFHYLNLLYFTLA